MTPHEFDDALSALGYSQCDFARSLDINDRTVRRWSSGDVPVPGPIVFTLRLMLKYSILQMLGASK